jgi:site-specific DNA-methyltransferase (adenine-specific)
MNRPPLDLAPPAVVRPAEDLAELAERINAEHAAGERETRRGLEHFRKAGEDLLKAKARVGHGKWLKWLKVSMKFSQPTAWNYMKLAENWDKLSTANNLRDALRLLTEDAPAEEINGQAESAAEDRQRLVIPPGRAMSRVLFSSVSDRWATPLDVYQALHKEFRFSLDPCPLDGGADGLSPAVSWRGQRVFCNPPYGPGIGKWLGRGGEAELAVFLLPARTDTRWFHEQVLPRAAEVRFLRGRLKFGPAKNGAPFPSMVVVYPPGPGT